MESADDTYSVPLVDSSTLGALEGDDYHLSIAPPPPTAGGELVLLMLRIASSCEWTVRLEALPQD